MKIAILIGISNYTHLTKLQACINDLNSMSDIVKASEEYDEVLVLDSKNNNFLKNKKELESFILGHSGRTIEKLLFYYSGHGNYNNDEFYYLWNEYIEKEPEENCLNNSVVDNLLKTLNPDLTIKIIDACHSGIRYVKDVVDSRITDTLNTEKYNEKMKKYVNCSKEGFKDCYFFFSSRSDEKSWTVTNLSIFTKSLIQAIESSVSENVSFLKIINFITEYFEVTNYQTPYFVIQGDFKDTFIKKTPQLNNLFVLDKHNFYDLKKDINFNDIIEGLTKWPLPVGRALLIKELFNIFIFDIQTFTNCLLIAKYKPVLNMNDRPDTLIITFVNSIIGNNQILLKNTFNELYKSKSDSQLLKIIAEEM